MKFRPLSVVCSALVVFAAAFSACRTAQPEQEEQPRPFGDVRSEAPPAKGAAPAAVVNGGSGASGVKSANGAKATNTPIASTPKSAAVDVPKPTTTNAPTSQDSASTDAKTLVKPPNRDVKGPPDVDKYMEALESRDRQKELKVDVVVQRMELPTDAIIGDLGCGPGVFTFAFAKACPEGTIYASDIEPAEIDHVREKAERSGLRNVVPVLAGKGDPHFPLGRLDYVFIADTYHHLEDRVVYLRRLVDVLKPGGKLVLLEYKSGKLPIGPPPEHKLPEGVMDKELVQAGWVLIDRFPTHAYHDFEVWRPRHPWEPRD